MSIFGSIKNNKIQVCMVHKKMFYKNFVVVYIFMGDTSEEGEKNVSIKTFNKNKDSSLYSPVNRFKHFISNFQKTISQ